MVPCGVRLNHFTSQLRMRDANVLLHRSCRPQLRSAHLPLVYRQGDDERREGSLETRLSPPRLPTDSPVARCQLLCTRRFRGACIIARLGHFGRSLGSMNSPPKSPAEVWWAHPRLDS